MAGYSKIYCIGGEGGFMGADGINPIIAQLWVGDGGRQWFEARYFEKGFKAMASVKSMVPKGPNTMEGLIDATILFFPEHYRTCPSYSVAVRQLKGVDMVDFDLKNGVPEIWSTLRKEAKPHFKTLNIYMANLNPLRKSKPIF